MGKGTIKYFVLKALCVIAPVPLCLVLIYLWLDPFRVVKDYENYFADNDFYVNKEMVSVNTYLQNEASGRLCKSFIFGSSVSCYYPIADWLQYVQPDSVAMHFDSSSETIWSMARKVDWLASRTDIRHALIILDAHILANTEENTISTIPDPRLSDKPFSWARFHYKFFTSFADLNFLISYLPYLATGEKKQYGRSPIFETQNIVYDKSINEESIPDWDAEITCHPQTFAAKHVTPLKDSIKPTVQRRLLVGSKLDAIESIANTLHKKNTDVMVIISPNRKGIVLNPIDETILVNLFGKDNVANLSQSMLAQATASDTLYYDDIHYRAPLARQYMKQAYSKRK